MTRCVKIGNAMELCKEENDIVRISVEIPNSWGEYIDADAIKSYSRTVPSDSPFNSELKEFKEDMFFKASDITNLYNYISHMEILSNQFTMKSLETDGQVYYISIIPFQQSESESKIALRIAKCQRQPFKEKASGVTFFPFSFKSHLKYYLEKFLSKEQKEEIIPTE